ncbi:MAG: PorV/PorQ family protein [Elusimicrobiota bacterium]
MIKRLVLIFAVLAALGGLTTRAFAGEPGAAGAAFLKIGAGPRAIGMGETHTAVADDAYASYWNPAGLASLQAPELALTYTQHLEGIQQQYLSYAHPLRGASALGLNVTRLSVAPFDGYDNNGVKTGSVSSDDLALGGAAAKTFSFPGDDAPSVSLGCNIKAVRERLASKSASTVGADFGVLSTDWEGWAGSWAKGLRAGAALRHFGPGLKFVSETAALPATLSLGLALQRELWKDPLILAADYSEGAASRGELSFGGEYWIRRTVAFRAGWRTGQDEGMGLRMGIGVRMHLVQMDYAFAGFGALGSVHRVGLTFRFGTAPEKPHQGIDEILQSARGLMEQARYYEAILEINRALEIDPGDSRTLELLKKVRAKMQVGAPSGRQP